MSRYFVIDEEERKKFVFGWDQPLLTFYLQVHDLTRPEDEQIVAWAGSLPDNSMYEVDELVRVAHKHGLELDLSTQIQLYSDKDKGQ